MRLTRWSRSFLMALAALAMVAGVASPALAQFGPIQPGGVIASTSASGAVNSSNSGTSAQTFLTHTVATSTLLQAPVRVISRGYLASAPSSPGTFTIAFTFGAISALTVVDGATLTDNLSDVPYELACSVVPTAATATAAISGLAKEIVCDFTYRSAGAAGAAGTFVRFQRRTTGTISATTTQAITATVTFGTASIGNGLVAQHNQVLLGN